MKLKTKFQDEDFELGEVIEADIYHVGNGGVKVVAEPARGGIVTFYFDTLKEINEMFEDYEEPKEHWCITMYGGITRIKDDEEPIEDLIEIGNYFSSKEDAYDAWDKLKAWQRLKDKGAEFYSWRRNQTGTYELYLRWKDRIPRSYEVKNDLDLLFFRESGE